MVSARPLVLAVAAVTCATVSVADARAAFRARELAAMAPAATSFAKTSFAWVEDPHAADPCTSEPGCFNSGKYGYDVVPMNVSTDVNVVFQETTRPKGVSAVLNLNIFTQPGCGVSACRQVKTLIFFTKEECFNGWVQKNATEPDGTTAKLEFGGIYYQDSPTGELYAKFEKKNYLTEKTTCTYQVRSGFKRWF